MTSKVELYMDVAAWVLGWSSLSDYLGVETRWLEMSLCPGDGGSGEGDQR